MSLIISFLYCVIAVLFTVLVAVYLWFQFRYSYWKRKSIDYEKPRFPFGNFQGVGTTDSFDEIFKKIHNSHKQTKVVGIYFFGNPILLVRDLNIIKNILIRDFDSFLDRGLMQTGKYDPLAAHLPFLEGTRWKNVRMKLTPIFTSGKVKIMFPSILKCGEDLKEFLRTTLANEDTIEAKEIALRFTMDVIALSAFGLDLRSFQNPNSELKSMGDYLLKPTLFELARNCFSFSFPKMAAFLRVRMVPQKVEDFFMDIITKMIEHREKNHIQRNDFMQLLIELKNREIDNADDPTFTINQVAAEAFGFFLAGFESLATTLVFCLFELALHPEIQDQLREEVDRVVAENDKNITYDGIQEMKYLDQVVLETLRKYPPIQNILRSCTKSCHIPGINATIEKNTKVIISVLGLHHDPDFYPDPEKFDPNRFSAECKKIRNPMCYLPFGEGPRNCIGSRFGLMETKIGLVTVISNFKVALSEKTKIPLRSNPKSFVTDIEGEVFLKILNRF